MSPVPRLLAVTEVALMGEDPARTARAFLEETRAAGLSAAIQWREKGASARELYLRLLDLCNADPAGIFVNDRTDVALALGLGVHLTEASLPTRVARSLLPSGAGLGRSTHDLRSARRAEAEGADYVVFGPVFDTPSKRSFGPPQGLARLEEAATNLRIPVLAIGGVDVSNARECRTAGAHGIAAIRAVWSQTSPGRAAAELLLAFEAET